MKCKYGDREIDVSGKAFRVIYKEQGYTLVEEPMQEPVKEEPEGDEQGEPKHLEDMTLTELKALAKEKGLEGVSALNKAELLEVLKEVV